MNSRQWIETLCLPAPLHKGLHCQLLSFGLTTEPFIHWSIAQTKGLLREVILLSGPTWSSNKGWIPVFALDRYSTHVNSYCIDCKEKHLNLCLASFIGCEHSIPLCHPVFINRQAQARPRLTAAQSCRYYTNSRLILFSVNKEMERWVALQSFIKTCSWEHFSWQQQIHGPYQMHLWS